MRLIRTLGFLSGARGLRRSIGLPALFLTAVLILGMTDTAKAFEDAEIRIEVNATDGDAGLPDILGRRTLEEGKGQGTRRTHCLFGQ